VTTFLPETLTGGASTVQCLVRLIDCLTFFLTILGSIFSVLSSFYLFLIILEFYLLLVLLLFFFFNLFSFSYLSFSSLLLNHLNFHL